MFRKQKGFTLIELLVVISIIGVLSTIAMTSLNSVRAKARDSKRIQEIEQIKTALELYYATYGHYPQYTSIGTRCNTTVSNSLGALVVAGFFSSIPVDPINSSSPNPRYCYEYNGIGTASSYSLTSSGWYCDGRSRIDYEYYLLFSTEVSSNYSRLTDAAGNPNNEYKYCIHGPLRQ